MKDILHSIVWYPIGILCLPLIGLAWSIHMYGLIRWTKRRQRELAASQLGWG